jgi:Mg2+ and Co2+ transporter CorA
MVTAYLFDKKQGKEVESWLDCLHALRKDRVLWLDLTDPSDDQLQEVGEALELEKFDPAVLADPEREPRLEQYEGYLHVTAVAVSEAESDSARERVVVDCLVGPNWVMTAHKANIAALDAFRELVTGKGELGGLDAPSFLSALLEWVVTSYLRAFDEIEASLEDFDISVLASPSNNPEEQITTLVEARRRAGQLRRSLAPHREIFAALSHSEFDPISSDGSAEKFTELIARVDTALSAARDAKDGIASSFDVLIVRTEHRTNEIIKILTLASILLLPGALIAGVAGMNANFSLHVFGSSPLFWITVASIISIALVTLGLARLRRWI